MSKQSNNEQEIVDKIQRMPIIPLKLNERQAFVATCWSKVLFMDYGLFWEMAQECLGETIINHEFANPELWERLKEKTKSDFEILVGIEGENK